MYGGTGTDGVRVSSFLVSGRMVIMGYILLSVSRGMLCIVSFLHVLEANVIDVTSVSGVGDGYCATLIAQSFYRMPAYKTYSCKNFYTEMEGL